MRTKAKLRAASFVVASLMASACGSEGAAGISDQLTWAANRMNLFGGDERMVVYSPRTREPYWILAVPAGTDAEHLATLEFPDFVNAAVQRCDATSGAVFAVVESQKSSCIFPVEFPEIHTLLAVAKGAGEGTRLIIRRKGRALQLAELH